MERKCELGLVGLGVMGRSLLLNFADHGYVVAGLDNDAAKAASLKAESKDGKIHATTDVDEFVASLRPPRLVILLVPAGKPVDDVINMLAPKLSDGDLLIDAGNSHFKDTDRRYTSLAAKSRHFFGMGVSGGEAGARTGPAMMPGGPKAAYERVRPLLEAIAAKVDGDPCVDYMGAGASGHYVKMVHNGIEYAMMQVIAECHAMLRDGLGLTAGEAADVFQKWHDGELRSFLIEITAKALRKPDAETGNPLVDMISDVARSKGTGKWTSVEGLDQQSPIPTIDAAVAMRDVSALEAIRQRSRRKASPTKAGDGSQRAGAIDAVRDACHLGMLIAYVQGFSLLARASVVHKFGLNLEAIARIWRGGCIVRSVMLERFREAFRKEPELPSLLLDPEIGGTLDRLEATCRQAVCLGVGWRIPLPGLATALAYYDALRAHRLPTNLIQAQRDFFGAHTYERIDRPGIFHTQWE